MSHGQLLFEICDAADARAIDFKEWTCNVSCDCECHETGTLGCATCTARIGEGS